MSSRAWWTMTTDTREFKRFRLVVWIQLAIWLGAVWAIFYFYDRYGLWIVPLLILSMALFPGSAALRVACADEETYRRFLEQLAAAERERRPKPKAGDAIRAWSPMTKFFVLTLFGTFSLLILIGSVLMGNILFMALGIGCFSVTASIYHFAFRYKRRPTGKPSRLSSD
jgi:hypothetical protein